MLILSSFVAGFQECALFLCTLIINTKKCISKKGLNRLYPFFDHCKKRVKSFAGENQKIQKSELAILYCAPFYVFWHLRIVFYLKPAHSRNLQTFAAF